MLHIPERLAALGVVSKQVKGPTKLDEVQRLSQGWLALMYDQAFVIDETVVVIVNATRVNRSGLGPARAVGAAVALSSAAR